MPTRFKGPNGIVQFRGVVKMNGRTHTKLCGPGRAGRKAAEEWERETQKRLKEEVTRSALPTVLDWANEYCADSKQRHAGKTFQEKQAAFKRFLSVMKENDLFKITPALAMAYLQRQCKERSGYAANKEKKNLAAAWKWGAKYIDGFPQGRNPFQAVDKFKEEHTRREMPSEEDFWKVVEAATGQDEAMLLTFFYLAARRGEIFRLKWSDVDFLNGQVRLGTFKTRDGSMRYDWLPMTHELKSALAKWKERRPYKTEWVFTVLDDSPSPNHNPGEPFKCRAHFMKTICRRAGVKPFGFHGIRHLMASIMFHEGKTIADIQRFLRHTNPLTTTKYLRELGCDTEYRERIMETIEDRRPKPQRVLQFKKENPQSSSSEDSMHKPDAQTIGIFQGQ